MEKQGITCPLCKRYIRFDLLGTNLKGEKVMIWHLNTPSTECRGSFQSEADAHKIASKK